MRWLSWQRSVGAPADIPYDMKCRPPWPNGVRLALLRSGGSGSNTGENSGAVDNHHPAARDRGGSPIRSARLTPACLAAAARIQPRAGGRAGRAGGRAGRAGRRPHSTRAGKNTTPPPPPALILESIDKRRSDSMLRRVARAGDGGAAAKFACSGLPRRLPPRISAAPAGSR